VVYSAIVQWFARRAKDGCFVNTVKLLFCRQMMKESLLPGLIEYRHGVAGKKVPVVNRVV
jgi:hypothetical protein